MKNIHRTCIVTTTLLLFYKYYYQSSSSETLITNPKFTLFGPYNTTKYSRNDIYNQLIDINNFKFLINAYPCEQEKNSIFLMVIISSNPINFENRKIIRNSWGKTVDSTKIIFLVGETENNSVTTQIDIESKLYHDIVQGNFKDAYHNMTYKHVMGFKWVNHHCDQATYILKTDDDVVVNIHALRIFLAREMSPWGAEDLIACQLLEHAAVQRSFRSKWRVSPVEYRGRYYPSYCAGWAVIYSRDVVTRLLDGAQKTPYFWIDDVHITGIIAEKVGVPRTPLKNLILSQYRANILTKLGFSYAGPFLFGPPDLSVSKIKQIWKAIPK